MDKPLLAYSLWLQLSEDQKNKFKKLYNIPRTGEVVVHVGEMMNGNIGGAAKQDGHRPEDLYAITTERSYELLNEEIPEEPNFYGAWDAVLANLDAIYYEQYPDETPTLVIDEAGPVPDRIYEMPVEQKTEEFVPRDPEELIKKPEGMPEIPSEEPTLLEESKPEKNATTKKARTTKTK